MNKGRKKIIIITPGQPSTSPRSVKEASALSKAGFDVSVIYNYWADWATEYDKKIIESEPSVNWIKVGSDPTRKLLFLKDRIRYKIYNALFSVFTGSESLACKSQSLYYSELLNAAINQKADLYIAHNLGALPVASIAAGINNSLYAFDAEDFHRGQAEVTSLMYKRALLIENKYIRGVRFMSAASDLIAKEYSSLYSLKPEVVNNTFPLSSFHFQRTDVVQLPLRLFWFSQTVGRGRGIEDVIEAIKFFPPGTLELTLLGHCSDEMREYLMNKSLSVDGMQVAIKFISPVHSGDIFNICQSFHIGLATEPGRDRNNQIALSNKIFTYLLAGNAIIFSETPAQSKFLSENTGIGFLYKTGDPKSLKDIFQKYLNDFSLLNSHRRASRLLAESRYCWELEREKLIATVSSAFLS